MKRWRILALCVAATCAGQAIAFSLLKPMGEVQLLFSPGDSRLTESQQALLASQLPKIKMLALENILIWTRFSPQPGHPLPTQTLAKQRAAAVADVFIRAGIDPRRVVQLVEPARPQPQAKSAAEDSLDSVEVNWTGHCLPGSGDACTQAYFNDPPAPPVPNPRQ